MIAESEHIKLQLEHARLKRVLLETQIQLIQAQHQLVSQEIGKWETELSIVQQETTTNETHARPERNGDLRQ